MVVLDKKKFGPWALITGASSGIGSEFARQVAASGINVALVARRRVELGKLATQLEDRYKISTKVVVVDLSELGFLEHIVSATDSLDIGLVLSNAGTGSPGAFFSKTVEELTSLLRLNTLAHLELLHYFGRKLIDKKRGGIMLVGALGAEHGIPFMANDAASKAYVHSFGESLHVEMEAAGVHVTVLAPGPTETPVLEKFGLTPDMMPMKPMSVEQCVDEALHALIENRSMVVPGRINRLVSALMPVQISRKIMAEMFSKSHAAKSSAQDFGK